MESIGVVRWCWIDQKRSEDLSVGAGLMHRMKNKTILSGSFQCGSMVDARLDESATKHWRPSV
jgi:hypothetical protein